MSGRPDLGFDEELEGRLREAFSRAPMPTLPPTIPATVVRLRSAEAVSAPRQWMAGWRRGASLGLTLTFLVVTAVVVARANPFGVASPPSSARPSSGPPQSPAASPSPSSTPRATLPPVTTETWRSLDLAPLASGPVAANSVTAWAGGYIALGQAGSPASLAVWLSSDGRAWSRLPADTFGQAFAGVAAACGNGIVVVTDVPSGTETWFSPDGLHWTKVVTPQLSARGQTSVAGTPKGAVAVTASDPSGLVRTTDGRTWTPVALPGGHGVSVQGVAGSGDGFVALGSNGTTPVEPIGWWSADGATWTQASVSRVPGDAFMFDVAAGAHGVVAFSSQPGYTPGRVSFWSSPDGRSWSRGGDPLGVATTGEGVGSDNGLFTGDGTRILGYGLRSSGGPVEYWLSTDATHWTELSLTGDTTAAVGGQTTPFLLRDAVLFSGPDGAWLGTPTLVGALPPACAASALAVRGGRMAGGTGTAQADLSFTNMGSTPCSLTGRPLSVAFLAADGTALAVTAIGPEPDPVPPATLEPGIADAAGVAYNWANWCGKAPGPLRVRVELATGGSVTGPFDGPPGDYVPRCDQPTQPSTLQLLWGFASPTG